MLFFLPVRRFGWKIEFYFHAVFLIRAGRAQFYRCELDGWGSVPGRVLCSIHTSSGAHPAYYPVLPFPIHNHGIVVK
jgi:hypothetical protein